MLAADELRRAHGRRRRDVRHQPQHQLHQRLHQALRLLRLQPRPSRGGGLLPADRGDRPARARGVGPGRDRGLRAGRPAAEDGRLLLRRPDEGASSASCRTCTSTASRPRRCCTAAVRSRCSIQEYLRALKDAGVGSLPGTSAEILDQEVRDMISPGRITRRPVGRGRSRPRTGSASRRRRRSCTATSRRRGTRAAHIALLRDIQRETGGITEFVPLSFIASEAPMYQKQLVDGHPRRRDRRRGDEDVRRLAHRARTTASRTSRRRG